MRLLLAVLLLVLPAAAPASAAEVVVTHESVTTSDGVQLDGWVVRPADGERFPVVLWSAPYFGVCSPSASLYAPPEPRCRYGTGDDPELWDNSTASEAVPVRTLLESGYAVAMFNVRGTGNSGGCFEYYGPNEQRDQYELVEWVAGRPWSTGAVAMMGLSYHATTAVEAAVQRPPHLRAIVVGAFTPDAYEWNFSPQGATLAGAMYDLFHENWVASTSILPPLNGSPQHATADHVGVMGARACPALVEFLTAAKRGGFAGDRDASFWRERRLIDRLHRIRVPVLHAHGLQDLWGSGEKFAEDRIYDRFRTRVDALLGQWAHEFPNFRFGKPGGAVPDFNRRVVEWLDRWMHQPRRAGRRVRIDYQDSGGAWHETARWPPVANSAPIALEGAFVAYPQLDKLFLTNDLLCPGRAPVAGELVRIGPPLARDTLLAGNPAAELELESEQPGGQVSVNLYALAPEFACRGTKATGATRLSLGAADLRFHRGNYEPRPFPVGRPEHVHVDLANLAAIVPAGHRIAAVVSFGEPSEYETFPSIATRLTVHPGSRLELPVVPSMP